MLHACGELGRGNMRLRHANALSATLSTPTTPHISGTHTCSLSLSPPHPPRVTMGFLPDSVGEMQLQPPPLSPAVEAARSRMASAEASAEASTKPGSPGVWGGGWTKDDERVGMHRVPLCK